MFMVSAYMSNIVIAIFLIFRYIVYAYIGISGVIILLTN